MHVPRWYLEGFAGKQVNHINWKGIVSPTDSAKSVSNRHVIQLCGGVFVFIVGLFDVSIGIRASFHRNKSDLLPSLLQ